MNELAFSQSEEADLVDQLRNSGTDYLSLIAEDEGAVIGHILFTPVVIEYEGRSVVGMGLAPMAVHPDRQQQGIGSLLVKRGLEQLRERQCPFVVVVGHAEYYPRFGFERGSLHGVTCQWDGVPDEAFMIFVLRAKEMRAVSGAARYRPEFGGSS